VIARLIRRRPARAVLFNEIEQERRGNL